MPWKHDKYAGPVRIIDKELAVKYGKDRKIFVEHCNDLFAAAMPDDLILKVLAHCREYPDNRYLFHTKNPARYADYLSKMPPDFILGATAETNRPTPEISLAPAPLDRLAAMGGLTATKLVTVEPVLEFDLDEFVAALIRAKPDHIIIGADSKFRGMKEPSRNDLIALMNDLRAAGIEVREKRNLQRLLR
jgi:protein gp37